MQVSKEEILHIANLAELEIQENEIENYEMSSFLAVRPSWIVYAK